MAEVEEVQDLDALIALLNRPALYPHQVATRENVVLRPYAYDARIGWNTYLVLVNKFPRGYTNGPAPTEPPEPQ
jgi:hypothetical protein